MSNIVNMSAMSMASQEIENVQETGPKPWVFTSGWRGHLAMHSHELAEWMRVENDRVTGTLIWQNWGRPESWRIGNCWNETEVYSLNHSNQTFSTRTSYWISESVAMGVCRRFRKDLLGQLRQLFADAHRERIERKAAYTSGFRESQPQEVTA
ncbi:hypothetical protein ACWKWV_00480 [Castellaniella ginsengisoli]